MNFRNKHIQKNTAGIILISMILPMFVLFAAPKKAHALPKVCEVIVSAVANKIKSKIKKKVTETVSSAISTSVPVNDSSANSSLKEVKGNTETAAEKTTNQWATEVCKQVLMGIARKLLDKITTNTIKWINSGFHGNPLYITNSDSFFKDIAKSQVKSFVDIIGYDKLRFPFGKSAALNAINAYKRQFSDNAQYTLSKVTTDQYLLDQYRTNFAYGGWNGFLINTQYPQNNSVGSSLLINEELARKVSGTSQNAAAKVNATLQQGMGFLSPKVCTDKNTKYNNLKNEFQQPVWTESTEYKDFIKSRPAPNPADANIKMPLAEWKEMQKQWNIDLEKIKEEWSKTNTCNNLVSTTPGSVVASSIMETMNSKLHQTELGAALGNSLSAVFDALINHFMQKGLNALTGEDVDSSSAEVIPYDDTSFDEVEEGGSCTAKPGSHGNDAGAPSSVDISTAVFEESPEVATWQRTGRVTGVSADNNLINVSYDKATVWPEESNEGAVAVGNPWIFIWRNGAWHTQTFSWLRPGQTGKDINDILCGGIGGAQTMGDFVPVPGEKYGFMVSGVARSGGNRNISERTDIFMYTWPENITFIGYDPNTNPPVAPAALPPSIKNDLSNVTIVGGSPTDVGSWPITSSIKTMSFSSTGDLMIDHDKRGQWPVVPFETTEQEATIWVFFYIDGKWYGTGGERLRPGQMEKQATFPQPSQIGRRWFYSTTWGPMNNYTPKPGEYVAFMISAGIARTGNTAPLHERTNVVYIQYPQDNTTTSFPPFATLP